MSVWHYTECFQQSAFHQFISLFLGTEHDIKPDSNSLNVYTYSAKKAHSDKEMKSATES